jgi:hypothetical protein
MNQFNLIRKGLFIFLMMMTSCTKSLTIPEVIINKSTTVYLETEESFISLNNSIVRFDPLYLQVRYKDNRSKTLIQEISTKLILELNIDPKNLSAQKALTKLYHFNSFSDLEKASIEISNSAQKFRTFYFNHKQIPVIQQKQLFIDARKLFIKNKIETLQEATQKKASGLWNDMVDEITLELYYWTLVQNEELELENGSSAECNDACCYEYKACLTKAASAYRLNFLTLGSGLAVAGGSLGALFGSVIPFIGTATVGIGGGIVGGVTGFIQAVNIYLKDQQACYYSYKACTIRQTSNK